MHTHDKAIADGDLQGSAMPRILEVTRGYLVGKTVESVVYVDINDEAWPCLIFTDGTQMILSRDDEGNGPGSGLITDGETGDISYLPETAITANYDR